MSLNLTLTLAWLEGDFKTPINVHGYIVTTVLRC